MKYLIGFGIVSLLTFAFIFIKHPSFLHVPYAYFCLSILLLVIPSVVFFIKYPQFIYKFCIVGAYFFMIMLLFEIVALEIGQWNFPGTHVIGHVNFFGYVFPFEELFAFGILFAIARWTRRPPHPRP